MGPRATPAVDPLELPAHDGLPVVPFVPVRCPRCRLAKPVTTGRYELRRYHLCRGCGQKFLSQEIDPLAPQQR